MTCSHKARVTDNSTSVLISRTRPSIARLLDMIAQAVPPSVAPSRGDGRLGAVEFYITLRDGDGRTVRRMPNPLGGTFDASGDFDDLLDGEATPVLASIHPHSETTLASADMAAVALEVDRLLTLLPDGAKAPRRAGSAWRGLTRFRAMVRARQADSRSDLHFLGD